MPVVDLMKDAELLRAKLAAQVGVADHPLAPHFKALGINVRPGMKMIDKLSREEVEVVHAGVKTVRP